MTVHSSRCRRRSGPEGDMSLQWLGGYGNAREHALHDVVGADVLGERFEREDDPVPQDVEREVLDVLPGDVPAPAEIRERATGEDEVDGGPRARAVADVLRHVADSVLGRLSRRRCEPHDVLHEGWVDENIVDLALQLHETLGRHHRYHW